MLQLPTRRLVLLHKSQAPFLSETPSKLEQLSPGGTRVPSAPLWGAPPWALTVPKHILHRLLGGGSGRTARGGFTQHVITSSPLLTGCAWGSAPGCLGVLSLRDKKQIDGIFPVALWFTEFACNGLHLAHSFQATIRPNTTQCRNTRVNTHHRRVTEFDCFSPLFLGHTLYCSRYPFCLLNIHPFVLWNCHLGFSWEISF